jgi:carbon storage regulator
MLVITRNEGEQFTIGENVTVSIVSITGNRVRIGITAPKEVRISRIDETLKKREKSWRNRKNDQKK